MSATAAQFARAAALLSRLPGLPTATSRDGVRFVEAMAHGSMLTELYAPRGTDKQSRHDRDELYFVISGTGEFVCGDEGRAFEAGDAFFVPAQVAHRFENFSDDFATWVVFWGPMGGEQSSRDYGAGGQ